MILIVYDFWANRASLLQKMLCLFYLLIWLNDLRKVWLNNVRSYNSIHCLDLYFTLEKGDTNEVYNEMSKEQLDREEHVHISHINHLLNMTKMEPGKKSVLKNRLLEIENEIEISQDCGNNQKVR